jgi:hypothetical protein
VADRVAIYRAVRRSPKIVPTRASAIAITPTTAVSIETASVVPMRDDFGRQVQSATAIADSASPPMSPSQRFVPQE